MCNPQDAFLSSL